MKDRSGTFEALYRAHAPSVFRRARNLLQCDAEAQDVVIEVFTSLYVRPEQFKARSTMSTFIYSMTTNVCLNRIRDRKNRARLLALRKRDVSPSPPSSAPDRTAMLRNLLEKMPEPLGQVAVYYYLDELTQEEIAEILGCSRRQVGNLLVQLDQWVRTHEALS